MENENLIIGILRTIQSDIVDIKRDIAEIKLFNVGVDARFHAIEQDDFYRRTQADNFEKRISRIERRLELTD